MAVAISRVSPAAMMAPPAIPSTAAHWSSVHRHYCDRLEELQAERHLLCQLLRTEVAKLLGGEARAEGGRSFTSPVKGATDHPHAVARVEERQPRAGVAPDPRGADTLPRQLGPAAGTARRGSRASRKPTEESGWPEVGLLVLVTSDEHKLEEACRASNLGWPCGPAGLPWTRKLGRQGRVVTVDWRDHTAFLDRNVEWVPIAAIESEVLWQEWLVDGHSVRVTTDALLLEHECRLAGLSWPKASSGMLRTACLGAESRIQKVDPKDCTIQLDGLGWVPILAVRPVLRKGPE